MNFFSLIDSICSIASLIVSLFVASKVIKLSDSNNSNLGGIQQGKGNKMAKDHAVMADNNSSATYNDYSGATIMGEFDEPPVLTESYYPISATEMDKYQEGISPNTCNMTAPENSNTLCLSADFEKITSKPDKNRWIGYSIKSMPMRDWRSFVNENYSLQFSYMATESIKEVWIEITNLQGNKKIHKTRLQLSQTDLKFSLQLGKYKDTVEDWKFVDEICFVFFPENCIGQKGLVFITDLSINRG
ncbi:MAG: hypothetical protein J6K58_01775 [Lachnospiraceae bacterium]|nr:hypothetical protein [Lachnospiraceae bacterium]